MKGLERKLVAYILRHPNDTQAEIAESFGVDQSAITRALLNLKKDGIVELQSKGKPPRLTLCSNVHDLEAAVRTLVLGVTA